MSISRRSLFGAMLAAAAAPAFVRSETLMRLWVPKVQPVKVEREIWVPVDQITDYGGLDRPMLRFYTGRPGEDSKLIGNWELPADWLETFQQLPTNGQPLKLESRG